MENVYQCNPQWQDWPGYSRDYIADEYKKLNKNPKDLKVLSTLAPDLRLCQKGDSFVVMDDKAQIIIYKAKITEGLFDNQKYISQIELWRELSDPRTKGVTADVFWNHLFPKHNLILTDCRQTKDGQSFWRIRVGEALSRNLSVSFVDMMNKTIMPVIDAQHFAAQIDKFYSCGKKCANWRIKIESKAV